MTVPNCAVPIASNQTIRSPTLTSVALVGDVVEPIAVAGLMRESLTEPSSAVDLCSATPPPLRNKVDDGVPAGDGDSDAPGLLRFASSGTNESRSAAT